MNEELKTTVEEVENSNQAKSSQSKGGNEIDFDENNILWCVREIKDRKRDILIEEGIYKIDLKKK